MRASDRLVFRPLDTLRARLSFQVDNTGYEPSREGTRKSDGSKAGRDKKTDLLNVPSTPSMPASITPRFQGLDIVPAIRGVHEHMSTWMSSLINVQDGCLQMVAQRASMGRAHQEHLAQQVAQCSMMPSMTDQVAYLRAQLAHREAQLEEVRAERDNHFVPQEEVLAHMRLLSSEAKDWKSRVVTEAEEELCRESAQIAQTSHRSTRGHGSTTKLNGNKQK